MAGKIAPVVIDFMVRGTPRIEESFRRVRDAVIKAEGETVRVALRGTTVRTSAADREAAQQKRIAERAAREKIAAMVKVDREVARIQDKARRDTERATETARQKEQRATERANQQQERELKRHAREEARIRVQSIKEADREASRAQQEAKRESARADKEAARWLKTRQGEIRKERQGQARFATAMIGAGAQGVQAGASRVAGIAGGMASTVAQLGGGFSIAGAIAERGELGRSANMLANAAYIPGVTGSDKRQDPKEIIKKAQAASIETGMDAGDLVGAVQSYVAKSADFKGGMANMKFFGTLAKATGSDVQDVANAAGILRVQNKNLDESTMKQMLLDVVMQGKQGSVEFSDLASSAGRIARTSTSYVGDQASNQRRLLGLSQLGMSTSGSVQEAATVLANISSDAGKHRKDIEKKIGKFTNDKGQITDAPEEFLARIMKATGGNISAIQDMGFGARSVKMFQALSPTFNDAEATALSSGASKKDARQAGAEAILKEMHQITDATYTEKNLNEDHKVVMSGDMERFEAAFRELKIRIGDDLLPELVKLIPVVRDLTPVFTSAIRDAAPAFVELIKSIASFVSQNKWLIDNVAAHPIGSIMAFEVTKSIGAAGLGPLVRFLIEKAFTGQSGVAGAVGTTPGAGNTLKGAGVAALAGAATYGTVSPIVDATLSGQTEGQTRAGMLTAMIRQGGSAREQAMKEVDEAKGQFSVTNAMKFQATQAMAPIGALASVFGAGNLSAEAMKKAEISSQIVNSESIKKAISDAVAEGARSGIKAANSNGGSNSRHEAISNRGG